MQQLTLSVAEILGRPGEYRDVVVRRPLGGVETALARLTGDPVEARLRVESVMEGVLVTGRVEAATAQDCARCLRSFAGEVGLEVVELYVAPGHEVSEDEDMYRVSGTEIDLEPMLRDALALALPLKPLCRPECRGLCATCGKDLNEGSCDCREETVDPRWEALSELKARLEG